jgi:hypothetical protein
MTGSHCLAHQTTPLTFHYHVPKSYELGTHGSTVGWGTVLHAIRLQVRFQIMSLEFFIDIILWPHYGPGVDSASNRNEYQGYFLVGKDSQCIGLTTVSSKCLFSPRIHLTLQRLKLISIIHEDAVCTSQRRAHDHYNTNQLMVHKEIMVYCDNHMKHINTPCWRN